MTVLDFEPQHAENTHFLSNIKIPESMQRFQDKLQLDQFFKFISYNILASTELKFRFLQKERTSWCSDMPREEPLIGGVKSQWSRPHCKRKRTCFYKDGAIENRGNSCEAVRNSDKSSVQSFRRSYSCLRKEVWGHSGLQVFQRRSQNWSWDWYVLMIKTKEKQTALFIGILWVQSCGKHFGNQEDRNSRTRIGFNTRFQYCINSKNVFVFIRAIQRHTGGNVIASELMGHAVIPYSWKEFLSHRGCSYDGINPQIRTHRWKTRKQRRKTDHLLDTSQPIRGRSRRKRT